MKLMDKILEKKPRPVSFGMNPIKKTSGLTFIEVIVVMAIIIIIFWFALNIGTRQIGTQTLFSERDVVLGLLRDARSRAMGNINQSDHGVFIGSSNYTAFDGQTYSSRNQANDSVFPKFNGVTFSGLTEIVFLSLSGQSTASGTIIMSNSTGTSTISINNEGAINW